MLYIYLHGFNSAYDPEAEKIKYLRTLGKVVGITYDSFASYKEILEDIISKTQNRDDIVFVGTSLGGFWAATVGRKLSVPSVIINPCYDPALMLMPLEGIKHSNYITGEQNYLTREAIMSYNGHAISDKRYSILPLVLLDMGDDVISSIDTKEELSEFPICTWEGGSHRFDHMEDALTKIKEYVNHCGYVTHLEY